MAVFIQERHHPYHNLLRNYDDLQLILSYSQLTANQYEQLIDLLQTKHKQRVFDDKISTLQRLSRQAISEVLKENEIDGDLMDADDAASLVRELRSFTSSVKFIEVKEERTFLPSLSSSSNNTSTSFGPFTPSKLVVGGFPAVANSSTSAVNTTTTTMPVPLLPLPLPPHHQNNNSATTPNHMPLHHTQHHGVNPQNVLTPPTTSALGYHTSPPSRPVNTQHASTFHSTEATVQESYRLAFQYNNQQIQLQYDVRKTALGLIEYRRGMVLTRSLQPVQFVEHSVGIESLPNLLNLTHLTPDYLAQLFSIWFEVFEGRAQTSWL